MPYIVSMQESIWTSSKHIMKRVIDTFVAAFGLLLLSPLFAAIAIAIKLQDGGPIFFRPERVGHRGARLHPLKFRTFLIGAGKSTPSTTLPGSAGVSKIGRFLRRTKLDELPQLINVLRGEMSLVGPRPEDPRYVALYTESQREILNFVPGITSAASLRYKNEEELLSGPNWQDVYVNRVMPEKIDLDLAYMRTATVWSDLKLVLGTVISIGGLKQQLLRNRVFALLDLVLLPLAVIASFVLRLEEVAIFSEYGVGMIVLTVCAAAIVPLVLMRLRLYGRYWPYASTNDVLTCVGALAVALLGSGLVAMLVLGLAGVTPVNSHIPRSIPLVLAFVGTSMLALPRVLVRAYFGDWTHRRIRDDGMSAARPAAEPVLILGAGGVGARVAREIRLSPASGMQVVGFLDDSDDKNGLQIHGAQVLGKIQDLPRVAHEHGVSQVIIAMSRESGRTIREIVNACNEARVTPKVMPGIGELLDGKVSVNKLRSVQIEDLLRRAPVEIDMRAVAKSIHGKRVLVTGGGGSIGSELCRQILCCKPATLVLMGHGENSIFEIEAELAPLAAEIGSSIESVIADIRFPERVKAVIDDYEPHVVFHAAAHKHVPLMEANPGEAITNNVLGTRNLLAAIQDTSVMSFVMISSDKAVNPSNVMGVSKRTAELIMRQYASRDTSGRRYSAVRFGNVLGSRGSVVLTFKKQIAAGGPVTLTHPDMKRYFMTIPEAVTLVLQASVLSRDSEIFVLDMGEPIKIADLAADLIRLSGYEVGSDIDIVYSGLRPGEKLYEELFLPTEAYNRTTHSKIFVAANASRSFPEQLDALIGTLTAAGNRGDRDAILACFKQIVPEFKHAGLAPIGPNASEPADHERHEQRAATDSAERSVTGLSASKLQPS
jgi:FlaA1/EpsC-like NDP-sugar epimerase/lipopolysaccharide/colanic/teichoic acid biosynthesis glycosyltransferase